MLGTWQVIYYFDYIFYRETNEIFDKYFFDIFTKSSMFIYLCHDLWITVIAALLVKPFLNSEKDINNIVLCISFVVIGVLAEIISFANYLIFALIYSKIFIRKKK